MRNARRYKPLLERLETAATAEDTSAIRRRWQLRCDAALCNEIRAILPETGIDPASAVRLEFGEQAEVELAAIPDTWELLHADVGFLEGLATARRAKPDPFAAERRVRRERHRAMMLRMIEGYRHRDDLNPGNASVLQLLAWCLARSERARQSPIMTRWGRFSC